MSNPVPTYIYFIVAFIAISIIIGSSSLGIALDSKAEFRKKVLTSKDIQDMTYFLDAFFDNKLPKSIITSDNLDDNITPELLQTNMPNNILTTDNFTTKGSPVALTDIGSKTNITTLTSDMTTAKSDISTLRTDMTTVKSDISILTTDATKAKTDITTLTQNDTKIKNQLSIINTTCWVQLSQGGDSSPDVLLNGNGIPVFHNRTYGESVGNSYGITLYTDYNSGETLFILRTKGFYKFELAISLKSANSGSGYLHFSLYSTTTIPTDKNIRSGVDILEKESSVYSYRSSVYNNQDYTMSRILMLNKSTDEEKYYRLFLKDTSSDSYFKITDATLIITLLEHCGI